jgi:hypothetical protein
MKTPKSERCWTRPQRGLGRPEGRGDGRFGNRRRAQKPGGSEGNQTESNRVKPDQSEKKDLEKLGLGNGRRGLGEAGGGPGALTMNPKSERRPKSEARNPKISSCGGVGSRAQCAKNIRGILSGGGAWRGGSRLGRSLAFPGRGSMGGAGAGLRLRLGGERLIGRTIDRGTRAAPPYHPVLNPTQEKFFEHLTLVDWPTDGHLEAR